SATKSMYRSLIKVPQFIFYQVLALLKVKKADKVSIATEHANIKADNFNDYGLKKIKVLHAIRQGEVGGGETHVLDLVRTLDESRYESYVLSFSDGPMVKKLQE